jgi:cytochrome c553
VIRIDAVFFALTAVAVGGSAFADGNPSAGQQKSSICAACHGPTGISNQDVWPNLASQKSSYIVKQLMAFKDGARTDPVMSAVAKILTGQDVQNLAAYFSAQAPAPPQVAPAAVSTKPAAEEQSPN